jgi:hypothetical protein
MPITQITEGLIADGAITANTLNSTQTFTLNNLAVTNTASITTIVFADNTVQITAYTGTNAQAYDQSLNTYDNVVFHNITSTGTISSETLYVGGTEGGTNLYNNAGEFLINNLGHIMMTMNFGAQSYNDQEVGAVTFNSGRFDISNEVTGGMIEALPDKTTFYTPIIGNTATLQEIYIGSNSTYLHIYEGDGSNTNNRIYMDVVSPDGSVDGDLYITGNRYVDFSGPVAIHGALTVPTIESGSGNVPVQIVSSLTVGAYTLGITDGTAGQALITNGMGQVSFQTVVPSLDFGTFTSPAGFTLDMGQIV